VTTPLVAHGQLTGLYDLSEIGRDAQRGGYSRHLWDPADLEMREWFIERARRIGLDVEQDRNGNLWAWWGTPGTNAVAVGSHLDSVPGGGAYDGPLGVVSALEAVARLKASGITPTRPVVVVAFAEEEGSRFGLACLGSRLMTGEVDPAYARQLTDRNGISLERAAQAAGVNPAHFGPDPQSLGRIALFIELHVEQGRGLIDLDSPLAMASSILAHGRWRLSINGQGNHAGTTGMEHRRDPVLAAARAVIAVNDTARTHAGTRATVGRLEVVPGGTNVIASQVNAWIDARGETDASTRSLVEEIRANVTSALRLTGCDASITEESWNGTVHFDSETTGSLAEAIAGVPLLPTGAGHDAGILAGHVPSAMLFVRNPTGISHSPEEFAEVDDCVAGVQALQAMLRSVL